MLLSKYVEIGIGSANYKYYKDLGYKIPMHYNKQKKKYQFIKGAKIKVKVEDLLISRVLVNVKCDNCSKISKIIYQGYLNCKHNDGKYYCLKCASSLFNGGEKSYRWNPKLTDEQRNSNNSRVGSIEGYYDFIRKVQQRDSYKCVICGSKKNIQVHHLNGFSFDKENQINPENAVCLCEKCHEKFHAVYGKGYNTKEQFQEFSNNKNISLKYSSKLSSLKKVVLLNNNKIYNTAKECANELNIDVKRIYDVCNHKAYTVNDYHFMYLEEYLKTPKNKLKDAHTFKGHNTNGEGVKKRVICVNTGEVFNCISDAYKKYLGKSKNDGRIAKCCDGKKTYVGKMPNGEKIRWKWYKE